METTLAQETSYIYDKVDTTLEERIAHLTTQLNALASFANRLPPLPVAVKPEVGKEYYMALPIYAHKYPATIMSIEEDRLVIKYMNRGGDLPRRAPVMIEQFDGTRRREHYKLFGKELVFCETLSDAERRVYLTKQELNLRYAVGIKSEQYAMKFGSVLTSMYTAEREFNARYMEKLKENV